MHPTKKLKGTKSKLLYGKTIILGVSSSIGAIECVKLIRELIRHGAEVKCIGTEQSKKIIGEYALEFASGNKVYYEITGNIEHIKLYEEGDALLLFPATANIISKISLGIADNIINTTYTMFCENKPVFIVPAMHQNMLNTIKNHLNILENRKLNHIINSKLEEEKAKIPSIELIINKIINTIGNNNNKNNENNKKNILIISGGTIEYIDKIRVISNLSSGKTGNLLAKSFCKDGHNVKIIYGTGETPPYYIKSYNCLTVNEMLNKSLELGNECDIIICCAAISDYIPEKTEDKKISSDNEELVIKLKKAPKIIEELRKKYPNKIIVGFKAEYNISEKELIEKCINKLKKSNLDYIIGNDLYNHYFGDDYNNIIFIDKNLNIKKFSGKKEQIMENVKNEILKNIKI